MAGDCDGPRIVFPATAVTDLGKALDTRGLFRLVLVEKQKNSGTSKSSDSFAGIAGQ